jgi:hypothetical protein
MGIEITGPQLHCTSILQLQCAVNQLRNKCNEILFERILFEESGDNLSINGVDDTFGGFLDIEDCEMPREARIDGVPGSAGIGAHHNQQSVHNFLEKEGKFIVHALLVHQLPQELHGGNGAPFLLRRDVHVLDVQDEFLADRRNQHVYPLSSLDLKF